MARGYPTCVCGGGGGFNGDGKLDLVVANLYENPTDNHGGSIGVLLGNGDGTFQPAVSYLSGGWFAHSVAVADVNGDGKPDLVVANDCLSSVNDCGNDGANIG